MHTEKEKEKTPPYPVEGFGIIVATREKKGRKKISKGGTRREKMTESTTPVSQSVKLIRLMRQNPNSVRRAVL